MDKYTQPPELLPCPVCGKQDEVYLHYTIRGQHHTKYYGVFCKRCYGDRRYKGNYNYSLDFDRDEVIEKWNSNETGFWKEVYATRKGNPA